MAPIELSKPIIDELLLWAGEHRSAARLENGQGHGTMCSILWEGLTRFFKDPRIPLDNNAAEQALRGVVVGRNNHDASKSKRGTEVAALSPCPQI